MPINDIETTLYGDWEEHRDVAGTIKHVLEGRRLNLEYLMTGKVIDIGCGDGKTLHELGRLYPATYFSGVDRSPSTVEKAKQNNPHADIRVCDFGNIPFGHDAFDVAYSCKIFDYSRDKLVELFRKSFEVAGLAVEVHRILRPGGIYFIFEHTEEQEVEPFRQLGFKALNENPYGRIFQKTA